MLAMDIVDTLRHRERLIESELAGEAREGALIDRLKEIYSAQGIEVPDAIIRDGVKALEEKRFAYEPPRDGFAVRLARLYVSRDRWLRPALIALALVVAANAAYVFGVAGPRAARREALQIELTQTLPASLQALEAEARALAADENARRRIEAAHAAGLSALARRDAKAARGAIEEIGLLKSDLLADLTIRIVSRPGEYSGIFRIPQDASAARNYYLIVEAVDARAQPHALEIASEEDRAVRRTAQWGVRVPEEVFRRVADDKADDQIIERAVIGSKPKGALAPRYDIAGAGGAILEW
jgi:hypothetical protein